MYRRLTRDNDSL